LICEIAMPIKAKLFIALTIAAGFAILLGCLAADHWFPDLARFIQCFTLALLASTFKIRLPGMKSTIAANFVLFLIALDALPFDETLVLAVGSCLAQCLWRPKTRPKTIQVLFSLASTTISIALASGLTSGLRKAGAIVPELVLASAVFFVVNSGLMSVVLGLVRSQPLLGIWRNCHRWAFPYYLVGSILAVVITITTRVSGWLPALAMLPLMYMVYACYLQWVGPRAELESSS
jgi:hypothetical protein